MVLVGIVLERLAFFHKFRNVWEIVFSIDLIFFVAVAIISAIFFFSKGRNIFWEIISEPKGYRDFLVDVFLGAAVGFSLAHLAVNGLFSAIGVPEFNAFDSVDSKINNLRYSLVADDEDATSMTILFLFAFYVLHVALNERLFSATILTSWTERLQYGIVELMRPSVILGNFISSVAFALLHIYVWNLGQWGYFLSAFLVNFLIFNPLFLWRGIFAAVVAHGVYDASVDIMTRTGLYSTLGGVAGLLLTTVIVGFLLKIILASVRRR